MIDMFGWWCCWWCFFLTVAVHGACYCPLAGAMAALGEASRFVGARHWQFREERSPIAFAAHSYDIDRPYKRHVTPTFMLPNGWQQSWQSDVIFEHRHWKCTVRFRAFSLLCRCDPSYLDSIGMFLSLVQQCPISFKLRSCLHYSKLWECDARL